MTRLLERVIGDKEQTICTAKLHWVYLFSGFMWLVVLSSSGYFLNCFFYENFGMYAEQKNVEFMRTMFNPDDPWLVWILTLFGILIAATHILKVFTTEIALTNQCIVYKTGLVFTEIKEIDLMEIRAERVNHGFFGRFLRYGTVCLDSRFVGDIYLPAIDHPHKFIKYVHAARKKVSAPPDG